jgi:hypothetical protein
MQIRNALLNGPLGFGGALLGNMFRKISDEEEIPHAPIAIRSRRRRSPSRATCPLCASRRSPTETAPEWSGRGAFTPEGVTAVEASRLFRSIFEDGLKALAIKFT